MSVKVGVSIAKGELFDGANREHSSSKVEHGGLGEGFFNGRTMATRIHHQCTANSAWDTNRPLKASETGLD